MAEEKDFWEEVVDTVEKGDFTLHQCYTKEPAKTLTCKQCGSDKFIVGIDDYFTVIKCPKCKWEECIHDG